MTVERRLCAARLQTMAGAVFTMKQRVSVSPVRPHRFFLAAGAAPPPPLPTTPFLALAMRLGAQPDMLRSPSLLRSASRALLARAPGLALSGGGVRGERIGEEEERSRARGRRRPASSLPGEQPSGACERMSGMG